MLVPVTGLALAWATLGEVPAPLELAGGVLVVGGVLWASRQRPAALPEPEPLPQPVAHRV
jgi:O-acetylserine/cysteine efflux transporter